jgi:hypothetical protein
MKIESPQNQYSLVIWLLIKNKAKGVTMKDCCDVIFHKFQSRLGEIEKSLNHKGTPRKSQLKILRLWMTKNNRFGHKMSFLNYKSLAATPYLANLLKYLNKYGLTQPQKAKK